MAARALAPQSLMCVNPRNSSWSKSESTELQGVSKGNSRVNSVSKLETSVGEAFT